MITSFSVLKIVGSVAILLQSKVRVDYSGNPLDSPRCGIVAAMPVAAGIFAAVAAALHVLIFTMESVLWTRPQVWKRFSVSGQAEADVLRPMAFNQGFYNLFLAIGIIVGLIIGGDAGHAIVLFACLSIVGAAFVLAVGGAQYFRAAVMQGITPLIAVILYLAL
jgi:putative membrane protein